MRKPTVLAALALAGCISVWGSDWLSDGHDPQRTGWQSDEKILTLSNVRGMKLLWKLQTNSLPPAGTAGFATGRNLFPPLIADKVNTSTGPKEIALLATVHDYVYAIDAASGGVLWSKHFDKGDTNGDSNCEGLHMTSPVIGPTTTSGNYTVYLVSFDGKLHQLNLADGKDVAPPDNFIPRNSSAHALALVKGVVYTMTGDNCGSHANYIYGYDTETSKTLSFSPGSGAMWGSRGPAIGSDGTIFAGTGDGQYDPAHGLYGDAIIGAKQNSETGVLKMAKYYAPANTDFMYKRDLDINVSPTIFNYKGKEYLADSSKECRVWLLDTSNFGGANHQTPVYRTPAMCNEFTNYFSVGVWGAISSWVDSSGTPWVIVPFWGPQHSQFKAAIEYGPVSKGAVAAFKVEEKNGKLQLTPAWVSKDIGAPGSPVIANGIVFAYRAGADTTISRDDTPVGQTPKAPTRLEGSTYSILYALDGQTGKELWSSGDQIKSFNHQSGLTVANGKVYIGTYDGMEYCFGLGK
jgi:outer membrane protein assembly factor BamB